MFVAAPTNAPGERPASAEDLVAVLKNHQVFQDILTALVRDLKRALQDKKSLQFAPVLQTAIKQLNEYLPSIRYRQLIIADVGIAKEAQGLINALPASPSHGEAEVSAFVDKRWHDMRNVYLSYKFFQSKLDSMVSIYYICM